MLKFLHKHAHWIMLGLCAALTFTALSLPDDGGAPIRTAAAQSAPHRHFTGETLALRPYLPDEPIWNAALGLWQTHAALDLACEGDVRTPMAGEIISVAADPIWGACVEIENDGDRLWIRSLSSACVREGDQVQAGDAIGLAGNAPCEAEFGTHIHLEYTRSGTTADPAELG